MVDEKDMPIEEARCWTVNGTDRTVDFYVNYASQPHVTDVEPLSIGPVLTLDGSIDRPYGTYTFEVRDSGEPDGEVLAAASVPVDEGDSFSAVLHQVGADEYRLSIYTNDYSPSEEARLVVRHTAAHEEIDWKISQNGETPCIPDDSRSGVLQRGQWQEATDVTESDYVMEVFVDGELVTVHVDLELEVETTYVVYVVGDPDPLDVDPADNYAEARDSGADEGKWLLVQAFEVVPGADEPDVVTAPQEPTSVADDNSDIAFDCEPIDLYETNAREFEVSATDPDGLVTGLAIDQVDPPSDAFSIVDDSVDPSHSVGDAATATLRVEADVPPDSYDVRLVANPESLGARATCEIPVAVEPVPIARLYDLVDEYQLSDDVDQGLATELNVLLHDADGQLAGGDISQACSTLGAVLDVVGANKGTGISEAAHDDLQTEANAVRQRIGCE